VADLLRRAMPTTDADEAVARFADALAWNWIIAGTDAHAKNYSVLLAGRAVRLAPVYDISSILPYLGERGPDGETIAERRLHMSMKVGGEYDLYPPRNTWGRAAAEVGMDPVELLERVRRLVEAAPSAFAAAAADPEVVALDSSVVTRLVEGVARRAQRCAEVLA
jgi:serine/threonine-protein kinase HipA